MYLVYCWKYEPLVLCFIQIHKLCFDLISAQLYGIMTTHILITVKTVFRISIVRLIHMERFIARIHQEVGHIFFSVYIFNVCLFVCLYQLVTLWFKYITLYIKLGTFVCDGFFMWCKNSIFFLLNIFVHQKAYLRPFFWRLSQSFLCSFVYSKP